MAGAHWPVPVARRSSPRPGTGASNFVPTVYRTCASQVSGTGWSGRYQHALAKLEHAARHWVSRKEGVCCALNIGDLTGGNESKVRRPVGASGADRVTGWTAAHAALRSQPRGAPRTGAPLGSP